MNQTRSLPLKELKGGRNWMIYKGRGERAEQRERGQRTMEDEFGSNMEGFNCSVMFSRKVEAVVSLG